MKSALWKLFVLTPIYQTKSICDFAVGANVRTDTQMRAMLWQRQNFFVEHIESELAMIRFVY